MFGVEIPRLTRRSGRPARGRLPCALLCLALALVVLSAFLPGASRAATPVQTGQTGPVSTVAHTEGEVENAEPTRVTITLLPNGTGLRRLAAVPDLAPGLMSAGLGRVLPDQTFLDISQGARAFNSLYNAPLPLVLPRGEHVPDWDEIVARAETAPGEIVPGLFASYLNVNLSVRVRGGPGVPAVVHEPEMVVPALMGVDRAGRTRRYERGICATRECRPAVIIRNARLGELPELIEGLEGRDLLIAIERPPPEDGGMLTIGIAGEGYRGNLTSATTRTSGYVLATDIAPTVIDRFGLEPPDQMTGRPIRSEGPHDIEALISLEQRMAVVAPRRGPVLGLAALGWLTATLIALSLDLARRRRRRPGGPDSHDETDESEAGSVPQPAPLRRFALALRLLTLSAIFLPTVLLVGAALRPGETAEQLLVLLGTPAVAALTLRFAGGWRALAIASSVTVATHAVDVILGSPLISLSLIGPNPGLGVRFYGIGNELGATLSVLILIGIGAVLAGFLPHLSARRGAIVFVACSLPIAAIFAAGRFGADVGSAIVIPAAGVVAAAVLIRRRLLALVALAVPLVGLALLVVIDLVSGGDSHFQRTVLDARGGDLIDTVARRLRLTGRSFVRGASGPFLPLTAILITVAIVYRGRIATWLRATPRPMQAAIAGAAFATVLGTVANDSGVLLLEIGTAYLLLIIGFVWAESSAGRGHVDAPPGDGRVPADRQPGASARQREIAL